jgi:hemolysin-activating ACP:hemolysin acyltransferase
VLFYVWFKQKTSFTRGLALRWKLLGGNMELDPWHPRSEAEYLGLVIQLMRLSPLHRRWRVSDIERLIIPPYDLDQFRCYRFSGRAAGLATWAYLSDQCADDFSIG